MIQKILFALAILLGIALTVFAYQNAAPVELRFGTFVFEGRRFMVIGGSFLVGFVIATLLCWVRGWRHKR